MKKPPISPITGKELEGTVKIFVHPQTVKYFELGSRLCRYKTMRVLASMRAHEVLFQFCKLMKIRHPHVCSSIFHWQCRDEYKIVGNCNFFMGTIFVWLLYWWINLFLFLFIYFKQKFELFKFDLETDITQTNPLDILKAIEENSHSLHKKKPFSIYETPYILSQRPFCTEANLLDLKGTLKSKVPILSPEMILNEFQVIFVIL